MTIGTRLATLLSGKLVGKDEFGNRYYQSRRGQRDKGGKRWVLYRGMAEASKVSPDWYCWLHYTSDQLPSAHESHRHSWQLPYLPNLTGTAYAWRPKGHILKMGQRDKATGDYEAWSPNER